MTVAAPIVADSVRRDSEGLRVNQSDQVNVITSSELGARTGAVSNVWKRSLRLRIPTV